MLTNQIGLLQDFALLLQVFALLQIFALLFEINCTEIDQSQSSIISVYIIISVMDVIDSLCNTDTLLIDVMSAVDVASVERQK